MCEVHKFFSEIIQEGERKPAYKVLLQEIEESCKIISLLRCAGYEFDRPAMAAERAHIFQLLEILEKTKETAGHAYEICNALADHIQKMPAPVDDIIKHTRDRIWPFGTIPLGTIPPPEK